MLLALLLALLINSHKFKLIDCHFYRSPLRAVVPVILPNIQATAYHYFSTLTDMWR